MGCVETIHLDERHLNMLRDLLAQYYPEKEVWAYGSRVKGTAKNTSDIDIVIFDSNDTEYYILKDALDESDIPFLIQIMRWELIPQDFKDNILEKYFVVQKTNPI